MSAPIPFRTPAKSNAARARRTTMSADEYRIVLKLRWLEEHKPYEVRSFERCIDAALTTGNTKPMPNFGADLPALGDGSNRIPNSLKQVLRELDDDQLCAVEAAARGLQIYYVIED